MKSKQEKIEQDKAIARKVLLNYITPDTKLWIVITNESHNGMTRRMKILINTTNTQFFDATHLIAPLCDLSQNEKGLKVSGCGMDMTFWLAQAITDNLWPDKATRPKLTGNGGSCLNWTAIY